MSMNSETPLTLPSPSREEGILLCASRPFRALRNDWFSVAGFFPTHEPATQLRRPLAREGVRSTAFRRNRSQQLVLVPTKVGTPNSFMVSLPDPTVAGFFPLPLGE